MNALHRWLDTLAPRERRLILVTTTLLCAALVWWVALAPALQTWRDSGSAHLTLDKQYAHMQALAQEVKALQGAPRMTPAQAQSWLETAVKKLGTSSVSPQGRGWQVNLVNVTPEQLAALLAGARTSAQLIPTTAQLKKSSKGWDGLLILALAQPQ